MNANRVVAIALALAAASAAAQTTPPPPAPATVTDPWVRGVVAQQKVTGAFLRITSAQGGRLVAVASPLAGAVEIHEMAMDGQVMRMRAVAGIDLPPGRAIELAPGGFHLMLMDLRRPLAAGDVVPLTLVVEGRDGRRESIEVQAPVRTLGHTAHKH